MTVRVRIMADILEMHLFLHLSNSHFLKKKIFITWNWVRKRTD